MGPKIKISQDDVALLENPAAFKKYIKTNKKYLLRNGLVEDIEIRNARIRNSIFINVEFGPIQFVDGVIDQTEFQRIAFRKTNLSRTIFKNITFKNC